MHDNILRQISLGIQDCMIASKIHMHPIHTHML
jgi:hypothetical protein